jgi:hypothetical protein
MKDIITNFINNLIIYDYILFGALFFVFLLFIIIGIILRHRVGIALFLILFAFIQLIVGSTYGYLKMHEYLFKNETSIISQKKLTFTQAIVLYGTIKNVSKKDFSSCKITAKVYKISENKLKDYLLKFKPINKMSIIENDIAVGQEREIKVIIEPFTYAYDYNVSLGADCK